VLDFDLARRTRYFGLQQQSVENQNPDAMRMIGKPYDFSACNISGVTLVGIWLFRCEGALAAISFRKLI
jgi:hypothetical protein